MQDLTDLDGGFWTVPFRRFHWRSLVSVTMHFVMIHKPRDYFGAAVFGLLNCGLTLKTKFLAACIIMHAIANLLLGVYVLGTQ